MDSNSLRRAAWAGLQDSMPRAALLSIHARVAGASATAWEAPGLVQLWGPRFSAYVVAAEDAPVFTLGRMPGDARGLARALETASRIRTVLEGRSLPFGAVGRAMGVPPNSLRYATTTGTVLIRWDGARQPIIRAVNNPGVEPEPARRELARRYLHVFGPATAMSFSKWAGIRPADAISAMQGLEGAIVQVRTPVGEAWVLSEDEAALRQKPGPVAGARLLPSGDAYYLLWGADRELLVPEAAHRAALWTTRVWPGALLLAGEIIGVWRRSAAEVTIETWRPLSRAARAAVEAEALSLPLPGLAASVAIRWGGAAMAQ
jgi:hypothetical protein